MKAPDDEGDERYHACCDEGHHHNTNTVGITETGSLARSVLAIEVAGHKKSIDNRNEKREEKKGEQGQRCMSPLTRTPTNQVAGNRGGYQLTLKEYGRSERVQCATGAVLFLQFVELKKLIELYNSPSEDIE